MQSLELSYTV